MLLHLTVNKILVTLQQTELITAYSTACTQAMLHCQQHYLTPVKQHAAAPDCQQDSVYTATN